MRHRDWTEALYAEDACDELWARLARAVEPHERSSVSHGELNARVAGRTGDWRGLHAVAARSRGVRVGRHA